MFILARSVQIFILLFDTFDFIGCENFAFCIPDFSFYQTINNGQDWYILYIFLHYLYSKSEAIFTNKCYKNTTNTRDLNACLIGTILLYTLLVFVMFF